MKDVYKTDTRRMQDRCKTAVAREMMLDVKDAVQDYIKMEATEEKKRAQQQLEEQISRLRLKDLRLKELDDVLQTERSQRERMAAQRDADDEPRQTLYLYRSSTIHQNRRDRNRCQEERQSAAIW